MATIGYESDLKKNLLDSLSSFGNLKDFRTNVIQYQKDIQEELSVTRLSWKFVRSSSKLLIVIWWFLKRILFLQVRKHWKFRTYQSVDQ